MIFLVGFIIGSFLNLCIHGLPRVFAYHCPICDKKLNIKEMIPIFSFLVTKSRCTHCQGRISWQYPIVELITALSWTYLWYYHPHWFIPGAIYVSLLIVLAGIDLRFGLLPNIFTVGGAISGLVFALIGLGPPFVQSILGLFFGFFIMALIIVVSKGGMGWGDAKLLAMIGTYLGPWGAVGSLFWGSVFGTVVGIALIIGQGKTRKHTIPFGPFLALGSLVMWVRIS